MPRGGGKFNYARAVVVAHLGEILALERLGHDPIGIYRALGSEHPDMAGMPYKTFYDHFRRREEYRRTYLGPTEYDPAIMPCPFCGTVARLVPEDEDSDMYTIRCVNGSCGYGLEGFYLETEMAIQTWNEAVRAALEMKARLADEAKMAERKLRQPAARKPNRGMGR